MTSQLNVDTIVDKAGSGGTNVKVGNTSTYVADGGSATPNLVQSVAKAWHNFDGTGTVAIDDSLNFSSLTDIGTGNYRITISSAMSNADYSAVAGNVGSTSSNFHCFAAGRGAVNTTTTYEFRFVHADETQTDVNHANGLLHGDLA